MFANYGRIWLAPVKFMSAWSGDKSGTGGRWCPGWFGQVVPWLVGWLGQLVPMSPGSCSFPDASGRR